MNRMLRIASCLAWSGMVPLAAGPLPRPYAVENYDVGIRADLAKQSIEGEASIRVHNLAGDPISALELDAGGLQIVSVAEGTARQYFERHGGMLVVVLTQPLHAEEHRTITVRYRAGPAAGLKFFADQVYATAVSDWMPCNDRPGERATLHLTISAPAEAKAAASGQLMASRTAEGNNVTEWQLGAATAPSWFGFALGTFAENASEADGVKLRVLGAGADVFEPTAAALKYLDERTGKRYAAPGYTQVFVHGDAVHAMAGLTLLPEAYAQGLAAKQPDALMGLADGLAQQWYGVGTYLKDWSDLWLTEGVSAYLAETFVGQRLGKDAYEKQVEHSRRNYNQLRAEGKDRPLAEGEWTTRQDAGSELATDKGVCFLYLVHELTGDSAFWDRLRLYTARRWDQAAVSQDFQAAFQAADAAEVSAGKKGGERKSNSKKNPSKALNNLFDLWLFGMVNAGGK